MIHQLHVFFSDVAIYTSVLIAAYFMWRKKTASVFTKTDEIVARINIGVNHLQMMLGIILATHSNHIKFSSETNPQLFFTYLHPIFMGAGIVFITLAFIISRNKTDNAQRFNIASTYSVLGVVFYLSGLVLKKFILGY